MNAYATDAHALVWHLAVPQRLAAGARAAFAEADDGASTIHVPAMALAECLMVAEKQCIPGFSIASFLRIVERVRFASNYRLGTLSPEIILGSAQLLAIPEVFDRLIVAEALALGVPLITKDQSIRDSGIIPTVWE